MSLWTQPPLRRNSHLCSSHFLTGTGRYGTSSSPTLTASVLSVRLCELIAADMGEAAGAIAKGVGINTDSAYEP
jgi:hypothetical protein